MTLQLADRTVKRPLLSTRRRSGRVEAVTREWVAFNAEIVEEFRSNDGRVARLGGLPVIILHTIGCRSGVVRLTPLIPVFDGNGMFVFATAAGAKQDPAWCANLLAHPRITIETADGSVVADVVPLPRTDAQRMIDERAATTPQLAEYVAAAAPRPIPVFSITPVR
jgi:deazaflavin-dependent oxidoreductase (nitroreductase family)